MFLLDRSHLSVCFARRRSLKKAFVDLNFHIFRKCAWFCSLVFPEAPSGVHICCICTRILALSHFLPSLFGSPWLLTAFETVGLLFLDIINSPTAPQPPSLEAQPPLALEAISAQDYPTYSLLLSWLSSSSMRLLMSPRASPRYFA